MKHAVLLVGCYGITTLVVNDAENIISLKCLTQSGTALYPSVSHKLQKWGTLYPTHLPVTPPMSGGVLWAPPVGLPRGRALTAQRFSTIFNTRMASPDTIILLSVDCHTAIGGEARPPWPLAYAPASTSSQPHYLTKKLRSKCQHNVGYFFYKK